MQSILKILIISALALFLLVNTTISIDSVEAKKKHAVYPVYTVQINFVHACSCTFPATIKLYDYEGHVFVKHSVNIGKLAEQQDDSEVTGPKIKVTQKPDRHPNELSACMINNYGRDCTGELLGGGTNGDIGNKFYVRFDASKAGQVGAITIDVPDCRA